jgi:type II secretory ATPase GspE/PulE/Tfp pilus assembly ATPase PilB-like protein
MSPVSELRKAALASGMRPMVGDGKIKILNGLTTPAEVSSITQVDIDNIPSAVA